MSNSVSRHGSSHPVRFTRTGGAYVANRTPTKMGGESLVVRGSHRFVLFILPDRQSQADELCVYAGQTDRLVGSKQCGVSPLIVERAEEYRRACLRLDLEVVRAMDD
jgi:hypothetical protein